MDMFYHTYAITKPETKYLMKIITSSLSSKLNFAEHIVILLQKCKEI